MTVPAEILKKVKRVEIDTRKLVNNIFSGEYHTAFKGQGMTFSDFREYVAGDDVRAISWALTARAGKPYIKTFEEERELTIMLCVDVSGSQDFGSKTYLKGETLTYVAATLAFSAIKNNDQVGLVLFSDEVELYIPAKKGRAQVFRILRELLYFKPKKSKTKISVGLDFLRGILKKRATIFLLSDFQDQNYDASLKLLERKHEVIAGLVQDEAEFNFPDVGLIELQDSETGETLMLDSSNPAFREQMKTRFNKDFESFQKNLKKAGVDSFRFEANDDYHKALLAFFKRKRTK
ncbi:MAG: hypothetical protein A2622_09755 [Bdellovibrionales bacterium RIFCSPHIGHO2_01_FULL_40_29]|nr:MAG: hypothetical protein A2622_09755 [Bdellovibrionales bacterium RIFCSPHIGHO2_01_FULL_40_29]OFZ32467.1 MAG: hypothetical protein A3D17_12910 [Bdellovibrionales bacterium RIFCSPHIGHO2_02_FULL_40_15]